jgi:hypothetical protein
MLAVITQAGKADERPLPQYGFLMELIPVYSRVLLKVSLDENEGTHLDSNTPIPRYRPTD